MAKKTGKAVKAKSKPVAAKKAAAKAAPKKAAKPVAKAAPKKAVPAKKAAKPVAKASAKKASPPPKAKAAPAKPVATKKAAEKPAKVAKPAKAIPAPKAAKPEAKAKAPKVQEPEEIILDAAPEEEESEDTEIFLTDAEGRRYCRIKDCDQLAAVDAYCRYHYLALWKRIQVRKKILSEGKLERYIEDLTARYPDKFLEMLRKDLRSEKEFLSAIQELEIDENAVDNEFEDEAQNYIDEVRGIEPAARDDEDF